MDYKVRFSPIELLRPEGWTLVSSRDLRARGGFPTG
jgi:arginine-tRNA-protein transferase